MLLLVSSLTVMAGATIAPALPQMAEVFQEVPHAVFLSKLILTIPALAIALIAPLMGYLIDRWGRLKVLFPSLVLYAIAGSSGFFVVNLYVILVGRLFLGIAVAGIMTTAITLIGDYLEGSARARLIGMQGAFMSLGGAVFVGLGGWLADMHWSYPFLLYLFSLILLVGSALFLHEPRLAVATARVAPMPFFEGVQKIGLLLVVAFLFMLIFYLLPVQLPFYLKEIGIPKNSMAGIAIATATLAATTTGFLYGRLSKRITIEFIFVCLFSLMSLGYLLVAASNSFPAILVAMIFTGLGMGMLMPNLNTWLLQQAGAENRGKFSGLLSSALFLGQFVSPLAAAPFSPVPGLGGVFLGASVLLGLGAFFFLFRALYRPISPPIQEKSLF